MSLTVSRDIVDRVPRSPVNRAPAAECAWPAWDMAGGRCGCRAATFARLSTHNQLFYTRATTLVLYQGCGKPTTFGAIYADRTAARLLVRSALEKLAWAHIGGW